MEIAELNKAQAPENSIPLGFCQCGCGGQTRIARRTYNKIGHTKGQPQRYIKGHCPPEPRRMGEHYAWKGGKFHCGEYIMVKSPGHPNAYKRDYMLEHIIVAEKALGKFLPPSAEVHHVNEMKGDNRNNNLVICQDGAYHKALHSRMRALKACGNPNWKKCNICKQWDDPINLQIYVVSKRNISTIVHSECRKRKYREKRDQRKAYV